MTQQIAFTKDELLLIAQIFSQMNFRIGQNEQMKQAESVLTKIQVAIKD